MNEVINTLAVAVLLWLPGIIAAAFYIGRTVERVEWNKLIEKGILPTPNQTRRKQ